MRAHQRGQAAASGDNEAIGKSRGGYSSKIHVVVDSYALPVHFELSGGQAHDVWYAQRVLDGAPLGLNVVADKAYDSGALREHIEASGSVPVIPRRQNSVIGNHNMDWGLYKYRHLVENAFARVKHFRAIANESRQPRKELRQHARTSFRGNVATDVRPKINRP